MYKSNNLDHFGLVSGMCDKLNLVSLVDSLLPSDSPERKVSTGTCVKAMILNGLGFAGQRLYLVPEFFSDKPVEHLFGEGIRAEMFNDDRLGRCLDDLYAFGLTKLFSMIASQACQVLGLSSSPQFYHCDSTSFHVDGEYNSDTYQEGDACIHITHGYSRDHRPDLHQVCLNMIVENSAGIPLFMEALSGNSSDRKSLAQSIEKFTRALHTPPSPLCWVADSALYSAENIQNLSTMTLWLTRVPETIEEVKDLKKKAVVEHMLRFEEEQLSDYRYQAVESTYGDVQQEWLLIFSQKAYEREAKALSTSFAQSSFQESKDLEKLCKKTFSCRQDAQNALEEFKNKCKYICLTNTQIEVLEGYAKKGKPKEKEPKIIKGYQIKAQCTCQIEQYEQNKKGLGFFVLASNDIEARLSPGQKLLGYKDQNKVEKGFRFLKDPSFHAATIFVKKPERVEAVLMIMALSLLVYAALERERRNALQARNETLPNQKKKGVKNPTMKWVFVLFRGIHCLYCDDRKMPILLNVKEIHLNIIGYFSGDISKYYQIE
jgi:transposase